MHHLTLTFPFRLPPYKIPEFRRAVIGLIPAEVELFHNHRGAKHLHWDYPLVQYGLDRGRAAVSGLGTGAEVLLQYLVPALLERETLLIENEPAPANGFQLRQRELTFALSEAPLPFGLHRWVALNRTNYAVWQTIRRQPEAARALLGRALTGHLKVLARQCCPELPQEEITARVLQVDQQKKVRWHKGDRIAFNVVAESRLLPPYGLGLGRAVAFGFGEVMSPRKYARHLRRQASAHETN